MQTRTLDLATLAEKKSLFLFGPRSTGKSTLLRAQFPAGSIINLLKSSTFLPLAADPSRLADVTREIAKSSRIIVIDEVQKIPALLDEVHDLIETAGLRFVLSGSSARKLKRGGVNLLAGRAWETRLFPFTSAELPGIELERYLLYGGLPQVWNSSDPIEELDAYVNTYLKEEVKEEALVQNFVHFADFFRTTALASSEQVNFANISRDSGVNANTVKAWFSILEDTFLGFSLPAWRGSRKRKAVATAKFYLFDVGVANFLRGTRSLDGGGTAFGTAFEHFIAMELRAWISYHRVKEEFSYWRSEGGVEVDFLVGTRLAIEVKSTRRASDKHLGGLRALKEEGLPFTLLLVSLDPLDRETTDGIRLLNWRTFLEKLWGGAFE
jgi:predicted AAA+ superfamily ATPase